MDKQALEKLLKVLPRLSWYEKILVVWCCSLLICAASSLPLLRLTALWRAPYLGISFVIASFLVVLVLSIYALFTSVWKLKAFWIQRNARQLLKKADHEGADFVLDVAEKLGIVKYGKYQFTKFSSEIDGALIGKIVSKCPPDQLAVFLCSVIYIMEKDSDTGPTLGEIVFSNAEMMMSVIDSGSKYMDNVSPRRFVRLFLTGLERSRHEIVAGFFLQRICKFLQNLSEEEFVYQARKKTLKKLEVEGRRTKHAIEAILR